MSKRDALYKSARLRFLQADPTLDVSVLLSIAAECSTGQSLYGLDERTEMYPKLWSTYIIEQMAGRAPANKAFAVAQALLDSASQEGLLSEAVSLKSFTPDAIENVRKKLEGIRTSPKNTAELRVADALSSLLKQVNTPTDDDGSLFRSLVSKLNQGVATIKRHAKDGTLKDGEAKPFLNLAKDSAKKLEELNRSYKETRKKIKDDIHSLLTNVLGPSIGSPHNKLFTQLHKSTSGVTSNSVLVGALDRAITTVDLVVVRSLAHISPLSDKEQGALYSGDFGTKTPQENVAIFSIAKDNAKRLATTIGEKLQEFLNTHPSVSKAVNSTTVRLLAIVLFTSLLILLFYYIKKRRASNKAENMRVNDMDIKMKESCLFEDASTSAASKGILKSYWDTVNYYVGAGFPKFVASMVVLIMMMGLLAYVLTIVLESGKMFLISVVAAIAIAVLGAALGYLAIKG